MSNSKLLELASATLLLASLLAWELAEELQNEKVDNDIEEVKVENNYNQLCLN
jgi:hypothetical protein